jgi:hypothetical protein
VAVRDLITAWSDHSRLRRESAEVVAGRASGQDHRFALRALTAEYR